MGLVKVRAYFVWHVEAISWERRCMQGPKALEADDRYTCTLGGRGPSLAASARSLWLDKNRARAKFLDKAVEILEGLGR
jgi:hypothetical protein